MAFSVIINIPGFWVIISILGMLATLWGTFLLAICSAPIGEKLAENRISKKFVQPAREAIENLKQKGGTEKGEPAFNTLTDGITGEGASKIERIEWVDGTSSTEGDESPGGVVPPQVRVHAGNETKRVTVSNFIGGQEDNLVQDWLNFGIKHGVEWVAFGFLLQFLSMMFRNVVTISF